HPQEEPRPSSVETTAQEQEPAREPAAQAKRPPRPRVPQHGSQQQETQCRERVRQMVHLGHRGRESQREQVEAEDPTIAATSPPPRARRRPASTSTTASPSSGRPPPSTRRHGAAPHAGAIRSSTPLTEKRTPWCVRNSPRTLARMKESR